MTLPESFVCTNSPGPTFHSNYANVRSVASTLSMQRIVFGRDHGADIDIVPFFTQFIDVHFRIVGDLPFLQKASFRVEVLTPKMRLKREIIFSFEEMIVSFGGAATLFLGISLWQVSRHLLFIMNKILSVFE